MTHIPDQLEKITKNINEAETILTDLKQRPRTEIVTEQIEHFESMLNKLNGLKESYIQLSKQYESTNTLRNSLENNLNHSELENGIMSEGASNLAALFPNDSLVASSGHLEQLKHERDRLRKLLEEREKSHVDSGAAVTELEVDVNCTADGENEFQLPVMPDNATDSDTMNIAFYIAILNHHLDIGGKMSEMLSQLELNENIQQGVHLLKEVMQRLVELRGRFQYIQNAQNSISDQSTEDDDVTRDQMATFATISEDLKTNFSTGVKCFKSAMDIIQTFLDPKLYQTESNDEDMGEDDFCGSNELFDGIHSGVKIVEIPTSATGDKNENQDDSKNNNNNNDSDDEHDKDVSTDRNETLNNSLQLVTGETTTNKQNDNNESDDDDEDDEDGDEDEEEEDDDSCREKDQDESMEIGIGATSALEQSRRNDANNDDNDRQCDSDDNEIVERNAMEQLRRRTEIEKKEILRLLEEKRNMQYKLAELKKAKERAYTQMMSLNQVAGGDIFSTFPPTTTSGITGYNSNGGGAHCTDDDEDDGHDADSNNEQSRPNTLSLKTGNIVSEMGSLLKLLSDVNMDESAGPSNFPRLSDFNITKMNNETSRAGGFHPDSNTNATYTSKTDNLYHEFSKKTEELNKKKSQIQQLQEMLNQIKTNSMTLEDSLINDVNDHYSQDIDDDNRELTNSVRNQKGRDSVTFQEPVATFIANDELYENMREVRMMREEMRDRISNSDPRSPAGRVLDQVVGGSSAPGAPPEVPGRMTVAAVANHDTASQDRTTAATWGSSSAGGDDYDDSQTPGTGGNHVRSTNGRVDEGSRVAPIGQSASFRSKGRDSSYIKNIIDADFGNLKNQIENIAGMCRTMAMEQNRLSRDIAELKRTSSPRPINGVTNEMMTGNTSSGPSASASTNVQTTSISPQTQNSVDIGSKLLLPDDTSNGPTSSQHQQPNNLPAMMMHWSSSEQNHLSHKSGLDSVAHHHRANMQYPTAPINNNHMIDLSWDEASLTSSNHAMPLQPANRYMQGSNNYGYQNMVNHQNMLLQNHSMLMKLQMSMLATQMEQQRLMCNIASMQTNNTMQPNSHNMSYPFPLPVAGPPSMPINNNVMMGRPFGPPFYPPPGPLHNNSNNPNHNNFISNDVAFTHPHHNNVANLQYTDPDYMMMYSYPPAESRDNLTNNPLTAQNMESNSWKPTNNMNGRNNSRN